MRAALLVVLLLISAVAPGQAPPPTPPPAPDNPPVAPPPPRALVRLSPAGPYAVGDLVTIDATESVADSLLFDTEADDSRYVIDTGGRIAVFGAKSPGTYSFRVTALSVVQGKVKANRAKVSFAVAGTVPDPVPVAPVVPPSPAPVNPPITPPAPAPAPAPFAGHLHATLIFDIAGDTPSTAAVRVSSIATDLKVMNCDWAAYDVKSVTGVAFAPRLAKDGITVPVVYVTDDAGNVKDTIKAPTAPADVTTRIKALRGSK